MENLLNCRGKRFAAKIWGVPVEGGVQVEKGRVFLCQNEKCGASCNDKLGYEYSWTVRDGSPGNLKQANVTDFCLLDIDIENYKDWQVGDVITLGNNEATVIFRSGELVFYKHSENNASLPYTCDELHKEGWRLKVDPE